MKERNGSQMIVAVDVGNTETSLGVFSEGALVATWTITTAGSNALDYMEGKAAAETASFAIGDAVLSSVVPHLTAAWEAALRALTGRRPLTVGPGVKTGIRMRYRDPAEVGADRMADLAAALAKYEPPLIIVDLGTTTNF